MKYSQTNKLKQPLRGFQPSPCHWTRKGKGHWRQKIALETKGGIRHGGRSRGISETKS